MLVACRRRVWEVGRAALPALQAAAPLTSTATAAAAAAADDEARTAAASRGRGRASPPVKNSQAADVQELRSVLKKYGRDGSGTLSWARSTRRRRRGGTAAPESATADGPPAASSSRSSGGRGARRPGSGAASGSGCAQAQASKSGVRELVPLRLTPTERHARQLESVRVNKAICSQFDRLDRQLTRGKLAPGERLAAAQACIDSMAGSLHQTITDINMSTFFHRLSRLLAHPQMLPLRPQLDTSRVLPVLVQRFEGLLDRILRKEARAEHPPSADAGPPAELSISARSLATSFWALGNMGHPLSREQLDKIGGVVVLKYAELQPFQIALLLVALNAYGNAPYGGKLLKALLERSAQLPVESFEARTLLNTLCAAAAAGATASQPVLNRLSLAALAMLPEVPIDQLGSLTWSLGKLGINHGATRIHVPVLHAITARGWRHLHDLPAAALANTLYGFGLLNFHPGLNFLDAAAARLRQLLPQMAAGDVANCVWTFSRLSYSPNQDREMWATAPARHATPYTSAWGQRAAEAAAQAVEAEARAARRAQPAPLDYRGAMYQSQAEAARQAAVLGLARRVAAQRAQREAFHRLLAYTREATAAALARSRAAHGEEVVEAAGQEVDEGAMADLVHYLETGTQYRPHGLLVLEPPPHPMQAGLAAWVNRETGVRHLQPFYSREQIENILLPFQRVFLSHNKRAVLAHEEEAAAAAAAEGAGAGGTGATDAGGSEVGELLHRIREARASLQQRREEAAAAVAAAAASGELEALDALFGGVEEEAAGAALAPAGADAEAAEGLLADPELADLPEGLEDEAAELGLPAGAPGLAAGAPGGGASAGASSTAAAVASSLDLDLDAVQRAEEAAERRALAAASGELEESEEESEDDEDDDEEEEEAPAAAAAAADGGAQLRRQQGAADAASEEQRGGAPPPPSARLLSPRAQRRKDRREVRQALQAAADKADAAVSARQGGASWRSQHLAPDALLRHVLADGRMLVVPPATKEQWAGMPRASLAETAERLAPMAGSLTGGELTSLLWSYATARHVDPALYSALLKRVDQLAGGMSWRAISMTLWSCAVAMQAPPPQLVERMLAAYLPQIRRQMRAGAGVQGLRSLCSVSWSLAAFDYLTPERFSEFVGYVASAPEALSSPAWCQLFQCALHLEAQTGSHYSSFLPPNVLPYAEAAWGRRDTTTSRLQARMRGGNRVADVLAGLGVPFAEEYSPRANFFGIDIAVQSEGVRLAVEVDGPQHFSSNAPHRPLASTVMRDRLLASLGWQVVSVPFSEWARLGSLEEQEEYLRRRVLSKLQPAEQKQQQQRRQAGPQKQRGR